MDHPFPLRRRLPTLGEVFLTFLKIGATGFGGPIALVALVERECCTRGRWVTVHEFNDAVLFCKLLPGPLAYQVALWVGRAARGWRGGLLACLGFLLPGFCLILALGVFYEVLKHAWLFEGVLCGVRVAALLVIALSAWKMGEPYRRQAQGWLLAILGGFWMAYFPKWEAVAIFAGGVALVVAKRVERRGLRQSSLSLLAALFWVHFKAGAFVYGTGVAVLPFLQAEVVDLRAWLTPSQFLDAVAFGQVTPGPLTIASAFIGFLTAGFNGAIVATAGMYLPGMILVLVLVPLVYDRLKGKPWLADFQQGAMPVVIGGIFGAWLYLLPAALSSRASGVIGLLLAVLLAFRNLSGGVVIALGAVLGVFAKAVGS